jgi:hypothetical protein
MPICSSTTGRTTVGAAIERVMAQRTGSLLHQDPENGLASESELAVTVPRCLRATTGTYRGRDTSRTSPTVAFIIQ